MCRASWLHSSAMIGPSRKGPRIAVEEVMSEIAMFCPARFPRHLCCTDFVEHGRGRARRSHILRRGLHEHSSPMEKQLISKLRTNPPAWAVSPLHTSCSFREKPHRDHQLRLSKRSTMLASVVTHHKGPMQTRKTRRRILAFLHSIACVFTRSSIRMIVCRLVLFA